MNSYILIISAVFPPEPVVSARLSMDLYTALKRLGYLVKVAHPIPSRPLGFDFNNKASGLLNDDEVIVDSYIYPQSKLLGRMRESWSFGKACAEYIKTHRGEISYIYANAWQLFGQRLIMKEAKKCNIPCMLHVQDIYPESYINKMPKSIGLIAKSILLPLDRDTLQKYDSVIAISDRMKSYLCQSRGISSEKIQVVVNWQDENDFIGYQNNRGHQVQHDKFTFMYMGNIGPVAGVDLLIDAYEFAIIPNSRLVIAGSGSMKDVLMHKAKDNSNIEFWDVPQGQVPEIQDKADCMLLPIKKGAASSSIPSKLPAYMFSSKPIIGCVDEESDTAEAIKQAKCGFLVEPENVAKLSKMMVVTEKKDKAELAQMGKNGQDYALMHFSKDANLKKLTNIIEKEISCN